MSNSLKVFDFEESRRRVAKMSILPVDMVESENLGKTVKRSQFSVSRFILMCIYSIIIQNCKLRMP